jgi:hypothetical protein
MLNILKMMENNLKKNGRQPQKKMKKMEDDLKKPKKGFFGIQQISQNQPKST